ncbi:MAG: hypothetical protein H0X51_01350 [Parachlamydiaceae bacterium]|nr:hypothetical protein [Parachlamydiaceae bacterium]
MGHFWKSSKLNTAILSYTLGVFTLSVTLPVYAAPQQNGVNLNDVGFSIRIEKLVEKINRYGERRDSKKLLEVMLEIKSEVEGYTGQRIDIQKSLDKVENDVKNKGGRVDKGVMKQLRNTFKKAEKRPNHKAIYMANCLEFNLPYNAEEEQLFFENEYLMVAHRHGNGHDNDDEMTVPLRVTIGVTIALCGVFLAFVPNSICQKYSYYVIETGLAFLVDEGITQWEDKDKKSKK